MTDKANQKELDKSLRSDLGISKEELKQLKKKLAKIEPRAERGVETLFRLLSKNQYALKAMIDRKSHILIMVNSIILSIILGTVLKELQKDAHLIFPIVIMLITNVVSIAYAIFATRPELSHGDMKTGNLMFYGNFFNMEENEYVDSVMDLIYKGDDLYKTIAKDTYYLGKVIDRQFKYLRKSFNIFLAGIILAIIAFVMCHALFAELI